MRLGRVAALAIAAVLVTAIAGCTSLQRDEQQENLDAIAMLPGVASIADVTYKTGCDALCSKVTATVVLEDALPSNKIRQLRDRIAAGLVSNQMSEMRLALRQGAATIPVDAGNILFDLWDRVRVDPRFAAVEIVHGDPDRANEWALQLSVPSKSDLVAGLAAGVEVAPPSASLSLRISTMARDYSVLDNEGDDVGMLSAATSVLAESPALTGFTVEMTSSLNIGLRMAELTAVPDAVTVMTAALGTVPSTEHAFLTIRTPGTYIDMDASTAQDNPAIAAAWAIIGTGVVPSEISIEAEGEGSGVRVVTGALNDAKIVNKLLETHPEFRKLSECVVMAQTDHGIRTFSFGEEKAPSQR